MSDTKIALFIELCTTNGKLFKKTKRNTDHHIVIGKEKVSKGKKVRKTIHNNEWWFVVEDVVFALTDTVNPKDYINKMRRRDLELAKGYGQIVHTLPVATEGGTQQINCANGNS